MIKGADEHPDGKMCRARYVPALSGCATLPPAPLCAHEPGSSLNPILLGLLWRLPHMDMMDY